MKKLRIFYVVDTEEMENMIHDFKFEERLAD